MITSAHIEFHQQILTIMDAIQNNKTLTKSEITRLNQLRGVLNSARINYTIFAHNLTIRSSQDGVDQGIGKLENMAPTFILRSESGYLAAIIRGDTRISYKKIKHELKLRNLSLATPEQVYQVTGAEVGCVSLINADLATIIDDQLAELDVVYGGCGVPYHTLRISLRDLIVLTRAQVFNFSEPKEKA